MSNYCMLFCCSVYYHANNLDINSQSLEGKILTSKTILFDQQIDGNMISRPVIIETCAKIDNLNHIPLLLLSMAEGAQTQIGYSPFQVHKFR